MSSEPVLDAETEVLIAQLVADSVQYFTNRTLTSNSTWDPSQGPSQIGASYHDYEEPLSSYERHILEGTDIGNANDGWTTPSVSDILLLYFHPRIYMPRIFSWELFL